MKGRSAEGGFLATPPPPETPNLWGHRRPRKGLLSPGSHDSTDSTFPNVDHRQAPPAALVPAQGSEEGGVLLAGQEGELVLGAGRQPVGPLHQVVRTEHLEQGMDASDPHDNEQRL